MIVQKEGGFCSPGQFFRQQDEMMRDAVYKQVTQVQVSHLHSAWVYLLLCFTKGGALCFQAYSPQRLWVLSPSYTDNVLNLICQVPPATLYHSCHQPRRHPWSCIPLSPGPVEQHVQHQGSQVVPVEDSRTYTRHVTLATMTHHRKNNWYEYVYFALK